MPTYSVKYDDTMSYSERANQVITWLDLPDDQRPQLILVYLEGVDEAGHSEGPGSSVVASAIQQVDDAVGQIWNAAKSRDLSENLDFIIVSDHGMTSTSYENVVYIDDYINIVDDAQVISYGAITTIRALHGRTSQVQQ
jgi:predicted AlkP superfamily pyrophosphatase or phosphodiesterase